MRVCVIPCYAAAATIIEVVSATLGYVDHIIVVDDSCPEGSGALVSRRFSADSRVTVLWHDINRGVGAAMKTGFAKAISLGSTYVAKIDADGQMDPKEIPGMIDILDVNPRIAIVKGNRLFDGSVTQVMPRLRLFGNSVLTLLVRATSGYWSGIDPTNGFLVIRCDTLRRIELEKLADRYFFEISLLVQLGMNREEIAEVDIPAIYGTEKSSLSITRTLLTFPPKLAIAFLRRMLWQYLIADMNIGSVFFGVGFILAFAGIVLGSVWEIQALQTGVPRTAGAATLVIVPLILGLQLIMNGILFDVQSAARVFKFRNNRNAGQEIPQSRQSSLKTFA